MFRKLDLFPSSGEGGGDLLYKEPRKIEVRLTLTTGDVKQQEDQLSKQEYYKHLISGWVQGV
jgi:hypothetical protein